MNKILKYLNNYFYVFCESGDYEIKDNKISVRGKYIKGQYIRIEDSILNDNVYKVVNVLGNEIELENVQNEAFNGTISSLAIPKDLIDLESKVNEFELNNKPSNLSAESFGSYSYSIATNANGESATWVDVFKSYLKPYRKMNDTKRYTKFI